ncbi:hypothetical protein G7054_g10107 [Neopestalotiopsis clavispora]|nr:hypothetical protein G7054_g10107 [Neopestalotiopsis clavispora]
MSSFFAFLSLATVAFGARPFLGYADTGIDLALASVPNGTLPGLSEMKGLSDFEWVAERNLNASSWAFYRAGAGGEWSYRNNLESYGRLRFRPRVLTDITQVEQNMNTTLFGHTFSAPFFMSPFGRAGYAHVDAELNLVKAAAEENILYIASMHATKTLDEIAAAKAEGQVTGHQFYNEGTDEDTLAYFQQVEAAGGKAIFFTVDSAGDGNRHRAARWSVTSSNSGYTYATWDYYQHLQNLTSLPIIPKGIQTVEDAKLAVANGAPAIFLSNHGARQLDHVPSSLEVALEIYEEAPEIFQQVDVFADGGVRYGSDVLKLMALGVKAVGAARPFAFANIYGADGVKKALQMLKHEVAIDCANMGLNDVHSINSSYIKLNNPTWNGWYS